MQGISKSRHTHLIDALLQMEQLLSKECECLQQAGEYRVELETMHGNYERLLEKLAKQITDYEVLYSHVKIQGGKVIMPKTSIGPSNSKHFLTVSTNSLIVLNFAIFYFLIFKSL